MAILLIGLFWLQTLNFLLQLDNQSFHFNDSENYQESAAFLFLHFKTHYYRPILMAFISGIPYLFGRSTSAIYQWSFFVNLFSWLGTSILVFEIMKNFLKLNWAFMTAIIPFFMVGTASLNYHLLTENLYIFFIICSFYFLFNYYKTNRFLFLSIALSLLLLSMLIKPGSKFFALIICFIFFKKITKKYKDKASILIYGSLFLIGVQMVGMKSQYGDYTISYIDSITYYNYICSKAVCLKEGKVFDPSKNPRANYIFGIESHSKAKKIAISDLKYQLQFNTVNLFKAYFSDVINNMKSGNGSIRFGINAKKTSCFETSKRFFFIISRIQNLVFSILGLVLVLFYLIKDHKQEKTFLFMAFFVFYIIATSGISSNEGDRFHLVTFPFVIMLLAKYISDKTLSVPKN